MRETCHPSKILPQLASFARCIESAMMRLYPVVGAISGLIARGAPDIFMHQYPSRMLERASEMFLDLETCEIDIRDRLSLNDPIL